MHKLNLDKIKSTRKKYNLSQSDMARIINLNTLYPYQRKESGNQHFTAEEIFMIANYFHVPVEYFFTFEGAKNARKGLLLQKYV